MAADGKVEIPIFARFDGEEIEIGTLEIDLRVEVLAAVGDAEEAGRDEVKPRFRTRVGLIRPMVITLCGDVDPAASAREVAHRLPLSGGN